MRYYKHTSKLNETYKDADLDCYNCGELPEKHHIRNKSLYCSKRKESNAYEAWQDVKNAEEIVSDKLLGVKPDEDKMLYSITELVRDKILGEK
jgi:hypothetical protein